MNSVSDREIVIIGAGPAGSTAAFELARRGHRPLLLEKDSFPGEKNACGGGVVFLMKDHLGLPSEIVDKEIGLTRVISPRRVKEFSTSRPQYLSLQRRVFDRHLALRARDAGAELLVSHLVRGVEPETRLVKALDRKSGREVSFRATLVLFADGPLTRARAAFGLGSDPASGMAVSLVYELASPANRENAFEFYLEGENGEYGYFWNFPKKDALNVGVGRLRRFRRRPLARELDEFIRRRPRFDQLTVIRRQAGLIPLEVSPRLSADGAMVLGDAAGLVNPLTGGGLVYAVVSGELAARAAHRALREGSVSGESLSFYDRAFHRSKYGRWLKLLSLPFRFVQNRMARKRYAYYPEILQAFLAFSARATSLAKKI